jgi:hypothetical protein
MTCILWIRCIHVGWHPNEAATAAHTCLFSKPPEPDLLKQLTQLKTKPCKTLQTRSRKEKRKIKWEGVDITGKSGGPWILQLLWISGTKCLQNYIVILDIHVYLFLSHPLPEAKKKAQGAQLAVENCSLRCRANAFSASILQGHHCSNLMHLVQFTMKNMNIIYDFLCAS